MCLSLNDDLLVFVAHEISLVSIFVFGTTRIERWLVFEAPQIARDNRQPTKYACAILERCRKIVLVLSEAVLVIETDAKNGIHEFEHEHRRERLSTSTTCHS